MPCYTRLTTDHLIISYPLKATTKSKANAKEYICRKKQVHRNIWKVGRRLGQKQKKKKRQNEQRTGLGRIARKTIERWNQNFITALRFQTGGGDIINTRPSIGQGGMEVMSGSGNANTSLITHPSFLLLPALSSRQALT